jgi:hypothetical protein
MEVTKKLSNFFYTNVMFYYSHDFFFICNFLCKLPVMTTQNFKPFLAPRTKFQLSVPAEMMATGERVEGSSNSVAKRKLFPV